MYLPKLTSTLMLALALVVGLTMLAPRPAQAGDLGKVVGAIAAGVLLYELLDDDDDRDHRRHCTCEYRDRGRYREYYRMDPRCPVHPQAYYPQYDRGKDYKNNKKYAGGYYPYYDRGDYRYERPRSSGYYPPYGRGECNDWPRGRGYYRD